MAAPRIDRLVTLYLSDPLMDAVGTSGQQRIPILMYHSIGESVRPGRHPYYQTSTTGKVFEDHVRYLSENGYKTLGLREAVSILPTIAQEESRYAVVTFDDGFADFYSQAFPILDKYGSTATMFLPTQYIGETPRQFMGRDCLTWSQVRELARAGMSFGSHTVSHRMLSALDKRDLEYELSVSKQTIEQKLGQAIDSFAYPFAFPEADSTFKARFRELLLQFQYECGVTTVIGTARPSSDPLLLERLPANSWDDDRLLQAKLNGAYNWLHSLQFTVKSLKGVLHRNG